AFPVGQNGVQHPAYVGGQWHSAVTLQYYAGGTIGANRPVHRCNGCGQHQYGSYFHISIGHCCQGAQQRSPYCYIGFPAGNTYPDDIEQAGSAGYCTCVPAWMVEADGGIIIAGYINNNIRYYTIPVSVAGII